MNCSQAISLVEIELVSDFMKTVPLSFIRGCCDEWCSWPSMHHWGRALQTTWLCPLLPELEIHVATPLITSTSDDGERGSPYSHGTLLEKTSLHGTVMLKAELTEVFITQIFFILPMFKVVHTYDDVNVWKGCFFCHQRIYTATTVVKMGLELPHNFSTWAAAT